MTCPVPGCQLIPKHVPYVTDFCHSCGGGHGFYQKMGGKLCISCNVFIPSTYFKEEAGGIPQADANPSGG